MSLFFSFRSVNISSNESCHKIDLRYGSLLFTEYSCVGVASQDCSMSDEQADDQWSRAVLGSRVRYATDVGRSSAFSPSPCLSHRLGLGFLLSMVCVPH